MEKRSLFGKINKGLFWDVVWRKLDLEKNKYFIIHRVLCYGSMDEIRLLFKIYSRNTIKKEFLKPSPGMYYPETLALCQFILGLRKINERKYLKNLLYAPVR